MGLLRISQKANNRQISSKQLQKLRKLTLATNKQFGTKISRFEQANKQISKNGIKQLNGRCSFKVQYSTTYTQLIS